MSESTESTTQAEVRAQAIRRLRRKRDFRGHIVAFLIVLGAFWAVMAVQLTPGFRGTCSPPSDGASAWPCTPGPSTDATRPMTEESIQREERRLAGLR
jgi:hypothetical protein